MKHEDGFTVIEVLLAILILSVGVLAAIGSLNASRRLSLVAERQTSMAHRAQAELERVKSMSYSQIGLTGTSSSWSTNVSDFNGVNSGSCPSYQPDHKAGGSTATEPLVINGCTYTINGTTTLYASGSLAPTTPWTDGNFSGTVYDFITYRNDPSCSGSYCPTSNDYKRITIVVTLNGASHPSNPAIISTFLADPSLNSAQNLFKNSGTLCGAVPASCSTTVPGTPTPNFLCDASYSSGCGQPGCAGNNLDQTLVSTVVNLLTILPTPDSAGGNLPTGACSTPPCYGLNVPGVTGCQGLPIVPSGNPTCGSGPPADNTKSHSWVGSAIPTGSSVTLTGAGAMTTFLESTSGVAVNATLCLRLYVVPNSSVLAGLGLLSTPISAVISANVSAAAGVPTPVTFNFPSAAITANTAIAATLGPVRIEFVVWLAASATPVEMIYDQAQFASEVTLMTQ